MLSVRQRITDRCVIDGTTECWLWMGTVNNKGYGKLWAHGRLQYAHRAMFFEHYGPIPSRMGVLHRCDNPRCVNPDHLFLGSQKDNVRDMDQKGRRVGRVGRKGSEHLSAKLTEDQVRMIRSNNWTPSQVARQFGITTSAASAAINGRTWKHL